MFCLESDDEKQQTFSVLQQTYQQQKAVSLGPEKQTGEKKEKKNINTHDFTSM